VSRNHYGTISVQKQTNAKQPKANTDLLKEAQQKLQLIQSQKHLMKIKNNSRMQSYLHTEEATHSRSVTKDSLDSRVKLASMSNLQTSADLQSHETSNTRLPNLRSLEWVSIKMKPVLSKVPNSSSLKEYTLNASASRNFSMFSNLKQSKASISKESE